MKELCANGDKTIHPPIKDEDSLKDKILRYSNYYIGPRIVRKALAEHYGCSPECFFVSYGIDLCYYHILTFLDKLDILCFYPAYPLGEYYAELAHKRIIRCDLGDDGNYPPCIPDHVIRQKPGIVLIVNPTNPGGKAISRDTLHTYLRQLPDAVFVIDEAYVDYCASFSLFEDAREHPNLVVLRSFSKGYGLPAIRCGYAYCSDEHFIERMQDVIHYFEPSSAMVMVPWLLQSETYLRDSVRLNLMLKEELVQMVSPYPSLQVMKTDTNFVLVRCLGIEMSALQRESDQRGITFWWFNETDRFKRYFGYPEIQHPSLKDTFRISCVDFDEMEELSSRFAEAMRAIGC